MIYSTEYIFCMMALVFVLALGGLWVLVGFLDRWRWIPEDNDKEQISE